MALRATLNVEYGTLRKRTDNFLVFENNKYILILHGHAPQCFVSKKRGGPNEFAIEAPNSQTRDGTIHYTTVHYTTVLYIKLHCFLCYTLNETKLYQTLLDYTIPYCNKYNKEP